MTDYAAADAEAARRRNYIESGRRTAPDTDEINTSPLRAYADPEFIGPVRPFSRQVVNDAFNLEG